MPPRERLDARIRQQPAMRITTEEDIQKDIISKWRAKCSTALAACGVGATLLFAAGVADRSGAPMRDGLLGAGISILAIGVLWWGELRAKRPTLRSWRIDAAEGA